VFAVACWTILHCIRQTTTPMDAVQRRPSATVSYLSTSLECIRLTRNAQKLPHIEPTKGSSRSPTIPEAFHTPLSDTATIYLLEVEMLETGFVTTTIDTER